MSSSSINMNLISPLCSLPTEILLMVMECLESPVSIRAFAFSYPRALHLFQKHRQSLLDPTLRVLNWIYPTDELLEDAVLACRLRLTMRNVVFLSPPEARQKVHKAESHGPSSRRDWYNLSLLCELSNLNNERDHFILRYTVHA